MPKKLTLHALAKAAKVSPATVSRVVAGNASVDPAIRNHVRKTADRLGIDMEKRRKGKSRIIAFLLANRDFLHSFHARMLLGAETYCSEQRWDLLFMSFRYAPETPSQALHLPRLLGSQTNVHAVILSGSNSPNLLQALNSQGLPFAVFGNNVVGEWKPQNCDVAYSDDVTGAYEATQHLIAKGHRNVAFIGNLQFPWYVRCADGYRRAMTEAGLEHRCLDFRSDSNQLGYIATKSLRGKSPPVTAILAGTDQVAAGVYSALLELGISIPDEMSVVGVNDTLATLLSPQLTTVRSFPEELGRHLAEFALKRVHYPRLPPQELTIPTQLIIRDSVRSRNPVSPVETSPVVMSGGEKEATGS